MKTSRISLLAAVLSLMALGIATAEAASISGTSGDDVIRGTPGSDVIQTFGGNDVVYGGGGDDKIDTGAGRDVARGESGHDWIEGGGDGDIAYGGVGRDRLSGQAGRDILHMTDGARGNDAANGGSGFNICHGDRGDRHERCVFSAAGHGDSDGGGARGEDVASGRCQVTGTIVFAEPVGAQAKSTTFTDFAEGTCTGTVNGRFMANERMYLRAAGGGLLSCSTTQAMSTGTMYYTRNTPTRSDDVAIDYTARSQGSFGQIASFVRGRVSGGGIANVRFRGDAETIRQCQAGTFRRGTYDMEGRSLSPLVG